MTPGFIDIVYSESSRHVRPRHREKHELHLVLFTLRPSRQFSSTPELINEPLNEREEGEKKKKSTYFSTPFLINYGSGNEGGRDSEINRFVYHVQS